MSAPFDTIGFAFPLVLLSLISLAIGWGFKEKPRIYLEVCGKTPYQTKAKDFGQDITCQLCVKAKKSAPQKEPSSKQPKEGENG